MPRAIPHTSAAFGMVSHCLAAASRRTSATTGAATTGAAGRRESGISSVEVSNRENLLSICVRFVPVYSVRNIVLVPGYHRHAAGQRERVHGSVSDPVELTCPAATSASEPRHGICKAKPGSVTILGDGTSSETRPQSDRLGAVKTPFDTTSLAGGDNNGNRFFRNHEEISSSLCADTRGKRAGARRGPDGNGVEPEDPELGVGGCWANVSADLTEQWCAKIVSPGGSGALQYRLSGLHLPLYRRQASDCHH